MDADPAIRDVLARVSLFGAFDPPELDALAALCVELPLEKGDVVCRAGEPGDRLFVLASGELEVWSGEDGRLLNRIEPGEFVGELSLLLGHPRSATVTVARAARLIAIDKPAFDRFFLANPKVLEHLSRFLAGRLAAIARGDVVVRHTMTVAVTAAHERRGTTLVAGALAAVLRRLTSDDVLLVRLQLRRDGRRVLMLSAAAEAPEELLLTEVARQQGALAPAIDVLVGAEDSRASLVEALTRLVDKLGNRFTTLVFDTAAHGPLRRAVEAVSDAVVTIVDRPGTVVADDEGRNFEILNLANPGTTRCCVNHCSPFVLPVEHALDALDRDEQAIWVCDHRFAPIARSLHRLARKLLGATVGLALGGGAAFGIAHVGVIKVLDDHDIPIDVIAGTSMGSIVGAGYASGLGGNEMLEIAHRMGTIWNTLWAAFDPTLLRPALLSGERMAQIFGTVAGGAQTFEECVVPYCAVAADAETGERVLLRTGSIPMAYRASAAVPLVWSPIMHQDRVLIDGSVVDPVPGSVVREMGADICIAVNVVPPLKRGVQTVLARWYHRLAWLNPLSRLSGSLGMPSMFDLGMNAFQMLQHELGNHRAISADVLITPDLSEFTWIEFYRARELIERGVEAAERALPHMRRVLDERLAARGYGRTAHRRQGPPALVFGQHGLGTAAGVPRPTT
jgi:NTE family protein